MGDIFKHFIITKINLGYYEKGNKLGWSPDQWLKYRVDVFIKMCLPSVLNQSCKNFVWIVYLDKRTPESIRSKLKAIQEFHGFVRFHYRRGSFEDIGKHFLSDFQNLIEIRTGYIISTRLDSDDMIHRDFVLQIQSCFKKQVHLAINFNYGGTYLMGRGAFGTAIHKNNPFISLIEEIQNGMIKSVFYKKHMDYSNDPDKLEIYSRYPMWCMTVHKLNISTGFFGRAWLFKNIDMYDAFGFLKKDEASFLLKIRLNISFMRRKSRKVIPFITHNIIRKFR
ncbi:glycosyltransferase [Anditalea andensis]|uniref:Uncharacterized protein n=1 Tax=Anditalea andensis TaxID=1048983 RepID=A0A074KXD2_9BACT|nr:glycosyltransferase [Anditalea andensis]KEO74611.1 hypothetical protein EL17_02750 [Anditalea andensis]